MYVSPACASVNHMHAWSRGQKKACRILWNRLELYKQL